MKRHFYILGWCFAVFIFFFAFSPSVYAEENRVVETAQPFSSLLFSWESTEEIPSIHVRVWQNKKNEWGEWYEIFDDPDRDELEGSDAAKNPEVLFMSNESQKFEYKTNIPIEVSAISYGEKVARLRLLGSLGVENNVRIISRESWGAQEELLYNDAVSDGKNGGNENFEDTEGPAQHEETDPEIERVVKTNGFGRPYVWPVQFAKKINFIVVHHTASEKNLENPEQALQNLYYYHTVKKKWGDIGYNFVIDPQGNIYEGRQGGDKAIGGHARGINKVSVGIAIMGNYEEGEIPAPVLTSLLSLVNFLSEKYGIDPSETTEYKGKTYANVNGHKDVGQTACPGKFLYQKLFGVRSIVGEEQKSISPADIQEAENRGIFIIPPQQTKKIIIRLKNISSSAWPTNAFLQAGSEILGFEDLSFGKDSNSSLAVATLKNGPIISGEIGVFEGTVTSTLHSTFSVISLKVASNGTVSRDTILLPIFVEGLSRLYEIAGRHDPKNTLFTGEESEGWIELKNTGNFTWKKSGVGAMKLVASHPRGRKSELFGQKTVMAELSQEAVKPGETGRFVFKVKAPTKPGVYREYFVPMSENLQYLEDQNLFFEATVQVPGGLPQNLPPIRVKLSFEKAPIVKMQLLSTLYDDTKKMKTFPKNTTYRIIPLKNGTTRVMVKEKVFAVKGSVRIVPAKPAGFFTLLNWRRSPVWNPKINDNQFRGTLEYRSIEGKISLINELPLEFYLKGLAEVSNDTPYEKIKAIVILARTYAAFYMTKSEKFPGKPYHLDDDPRNSQKYLGYGFEKRAPNLAKAVKETAKQYVTYEGKLVKTPYFSQSDGRTRSAQEVWGWTDTPYLQSVPDPDCKGPLKGHGVGLSGCGADAQARRGKTASEIIKYYYKGVEILTGN